MKIKFISNAPWLNKNSSSAPDPAIKNIPNWYKNSDRYVKKPDGTHYEDPHQGGRALSWKSCPAIYDIFGAGYFLKTPCDIEFVENNGSLMAQVKDYKYQNFIQHRQEMPGFNQPDGYRKQHFAWWPDWAPSVPEGYSILYSQPFNRFDLPFLNTTGIVDNDKIDLPGTVPFFIKDDWSGLIPEGTAYLQLLPFKRDDWECEHVEMSEKEIVKRNIKNSKKYRVPDGGVYLNQVWEKRKYV